MIADLVRKAADGQDLSAEEANAAMTEIMGGEASAVQIAAFLVAMRMKGETVEEVTEFARVMREHVLPVEVKRRPVVDTCGTGGDAIKTFNVSTAAAFVAAGAGVAVAKHGNRSVTSKCGSADVLEALDIKFDLPPEAVAKCIDEIGIGFMFAPAYHPAMKHAGPVRRELGLRTVFNALGPLTNPARAEAQVMGVYRPELTELHASVLRNLGSRRALVVHGEGGLDELSTFGPTQVAELRDGEIRTYRVTPEEVGLSSRSRVMCRADRLRRTRNCSSASSPAMAGRRARSCCSMPPRRSSRARRRIRSRRGSPPPGPRSTPGRRWRN